ncbi:MAG TPA: hypothetical protein VGW34_15655 [Allosphingosinicella sp.]|nr:hypothetical protein [Allosphingosinicella sp.]
MVSPAVLDGRADRDRVRLFSAGEDGVIAVVSVEDMIADRMGQYASGTARDMLVQARILFSLYPDADLDYPERRVREETVGDYGIEQLRA